MIFLFCFWLLTSTTPQNSEHTPYPLIFGQHNYFGAKRWPIFWSNIINTSVDQGINRHIFQFFCSRSGRALSVHYCFISCFSLYQDCFSATSLFGYLLHTWDALATLSFAFRFCLVLCLRADRFQFYPPSSSQATLFLASVFAFVLQENHMLRWVVCAPMASRHSRLNKCRISIWLWLAGTVVLPWLHILSFVFMSLPR